MPSYFGPALAGGLAGFQQGVNTSLERQAMVQELQRRALMQQQLQQQISDQPGIESGFLGAMRAANAMQATQPQYFGTPQPGQKSFPSPQQQPPQPTFAPPTQASFQTVGDMKEIPGGGMAGPPPAPQGVGPAGIAPYKPMSDLVRPQPPGGGVLPPTDQLPRPQLTGGTYGAAPAQQPGGAMNFQNFLQAVSNYPGLNDRQRAEIFTRGFPIIEKQATAERAAGKESDLLQIKMLELQREITRDRETAARHDADRAQRDEASRRADLRMRELASLIHNSGANAGPNSMDDPATAQHWYEYYDKTGKMPPFAWGKVGDPKREKFITGFAAWAKEQGKTGADVATDIGGQKSDQMALQAITKDLNFLEPYKKMLDLNGNVAITLAQKVGQKYPLSANKPILWLQKNYSADPDVAEYLFQVNTVRTEAARVLNNPRLVGQLTDSARKDMEATLSESLPVESLTRVIERMKRDGENRIATLKQQQSELQKGMRATPSAGQRPGAPAAPTATPATNAKGWKLHTDANGNKAYVSPDGKSFEEVR